CWVLSLKVAVAVSCTLPLRLTVAPVEEQFSEPAPQPMATDFTATVAMVSVVCALLLPSVAVMVVEPRLTAVARPVLLLVATPLFDEVQVDLLVTSCCVWLPSVAVAVNCCVFLVPPELFRAMVGLAGVMAMEAMALASMKKSQLSKAPTVTSAARLSAT